MTTAPQKPKATILYVDDDLENLAGFKAAFRRDYDVHLANSAADAIDILKAHSIQVLITDQRMPEMTGSELLERLADAYPDMLRFMLTGFTDFDPLVIALNDGQLQGYFSKPLDVPQFKARIENGLAKYYLKIENEALYQSLREREQQLRNQLTELKQAERETQEARGFAENLLETANAMIIGLDQDGCVRIINPMVEELTGYQASELVGHSWFERVVPRDLYPEVWAEFERLMEGGFPHGFENPILAKDGTERIISWSNREMTENGKIVGTLSVGIDITQRRKAEQDKERLAAQLRQAQKMESLGTLAGGIAHDFNNILSPIIGYAEIIKMESAPTSEPSHNADGILNAALRARDLVAQILTFSREKEHEKKPLKIQPIVKEALKLLRASLPASIELSQQVDQNCGAVMGDPTQVYQVMMNLCTNASQAMQDQGGSIEVAVSEVTLTDDDQPQFMELKTGPYVRIVVSDTGPGIPDDIIERIFDPYFTTKRMESGTGLGLSVVHGIIKSHAGAIKVYSETGQGTAFNVYLPLFVERPTEAIGRQDQPIVGGTEAIILVDDERDIVSVEQKILENLGYRVSGFTDGREALKAFRENPDAYDLVISDMTMPHMSGFELVQAILAERPAIPVVMCTGFSEMVNRLEIAKSGVRRVIMKPVIKSEIAAVIREVLDASEDRG